MNPIKVQKVSQSLEGWSEDSSEDCSYGLLRTNPKINDHTKNICGTRDISKKYKKDYDLESYKQQRYLCE